VSGIFKTLLDVGFPATDDRQMFFCEFKKHEFVKLLKRSGLRDYQYYDRRCLNDNDRRKCDKGR